MLGGTPAPALAEQLTAAGGNPLYLRELIDALVRESRLRLIDDHADLISPASDLPATLHVAIARRLGFLSQRAMSTLRMAAVLGPTFTVADVSIVTGNRPTELIDAVSEAVAAGVLAQSDSTAALEFRHDLVHQTLYEGMPASLRMALHRQAAEKLAGAGAPAEQVALQLLAGPPNVEAWAVEWLMDAAPSLTTRAPRAASDLLLRAREGLSWQDNRRVSLDMDLAMAQLTLGENGHAEKLARAVLGTTRDPTATGRIAWILAYALVQLGRLEEAAEVTHEAMSRANLPLMWRARLRARRATALYSLGQFSAARSEAEQAEAEGNEAGDRIAVAFALFALAHVQFFDGRQAAVANRDRR